LHSNAGARLRSEISLLPSHSLNPSGEEHIGDRMFNSPGSTDVTSEISGENSAKIAS
jgi:hypothetical protein